MKVLMIGPSSQAKGGIATVIKNFEQGFNNPDIELKVLTSWKEGNAFKRLWVFIECLCSYIAQLCFGGVSAVHLHVAQDGSFYRKMIFLMLGKLFGKSVILHFHASSFDVFWNKQSRRGQAFIKRSLNRADNIVVLSEEWAVFYRSITTTTVTIINNAVNVPEQTTYDANSQNIIALGRLGQRKGTYDILKIAPQLKLKFPEAVIHLYGDGDIKEIQALITQQQLSNVKIGGWLTDSEPVIKTAVMHLLPSYHEGMPMAILESMAQGVPNISTTVGGIPQVLAHKQNGLLITPGDSQALYEAVALLLNNRDLCRDISKKAHATIYTHFSLTHYHEQWSQLYTNYSN